MVTVHILERILPRKPHLGIVRPRSCEAAERSHVHHGDSPSDTRVKRVNECNQCNTQP